MSTKTNFSYEEAVKKLNSLQSNKSTLDQIRRNNKSGVISQNTRKTLKPIQKCTNLEDMKNYLSRIGITLTKLDELSVIHVAGTKGKGSTCAMCESILRAHGFRTGLFTSPHLVAVRERIKLDGQLISREQFASYFHHVFDLLRNTQAYEGDMPKYFAFQTVLAFNIFLKEKVDVAIIEVGIGGTVDYTNVLRKVPVVGITSLGLDHTFILGDTIDKIAAAKAGIMKPGSEAYSVQQPAGAMPVLNRVAGDTQCTLNIVPDYNSYTFPKDINKILPVDVDAYKMNASLAIQLAHAWMRLSRLQIMDQRSIRKQKNAAVCGKIAQNNFIDIDPIYKETDKRIDEMITTVPRETVIGLQDFHWPGRYQTIRADYATFCLDGAHTKESMEICAKWFLDNNR
ncbi:mur ligase middle domain-containing protein [Phthorimaea operculella]|nr:mur ligase middle domain-containing protein [Phthorimaea operculella]